MRILIKFSALVVAVLLLGPVAIWVSSAQSTNTSPAQKFVGLWEAKRRFGPDIRGTLLIKQSKGVLSAEIAGRIAPAKLAGDTITFTLADGQSAFTGRFAAGRTKIVGHWTQPQNEEGGPYASPVTLTQYAPSAWRGNISPLEGTLTFYLKVTARDDGSVGAFLKNPERNVGLRQIPIDHIELEGEAVKLFAAAKGSDKARLLAEGKFDTEREVLSVYFPNRGGTYDFSRVPPNQQSDFYPRGRQPAPYVYAPPPALNDGWPTASPEEVGLSRASLEKFVQMIIDMPINSVSTPEIHGVLIARHGKLVLEEYFHGEHRDKPHDTRSAGKSLTSTLIGAAMNAGVPLKVSSPVYQVMNGGKFPPDLDPRKRALTLEHLLTMSSGLDCDDNDDKSPGREDYMVDESGATDYYQYTMALKMIRDPGVKAVYCSVQPNLAGGVLQRAAGRPLPELMQDLIAQPLQIKRYYMPLAPNGDAYMGGGVRLLPRDFTKLAQLYLNGGTWNGRRVLSPEWCRKATSPLATISQTSKPNYGYLWWMFDYPYKGKTVRGYYASGNGWQHSIAIPELDLVIGFYAGNYNDRLPLHTDYIPKWILPAVADR